MSEPIIENGSVRDRFRSQLIGEAKRVALRQLAEGGPTGVSVNAIAKELGMSGPALYRYFESRDALMTALITDAYRDLASALRAASTAAPEAPAAALATAYRRWALEQPHRYRLLFAAPLMGHDAHRKELVDAAQKAMDVLWEVVSSVAIPVQATIAIELEKQLTTWVAEREGHVASTPTAALQAIATWTTMHGHVRLEIDGNYASMGLDPGLLFDAALPEIFSRSPRRTSSTNAVRT